MQYQQQRLKQKKHLASNHCPRRGIAQGIRQTASNLPKEEKRKSNESCCPTARICAANAIKPSALIRRHTSNAAHSLLNQSLVNSTTKKPLQLLQLARSTSMPGSKGAQQQRSSSTTHLLWGIPALERVLWLRRMSAYAAIAEDYKRTQQRFQTLQKKTRLESQKMIRSLYKVLHFGKRVLCGRVLGCQITLTWHDFLDYPVAAALV